MARFNMNSYNLRIGPFKLISISKNCIFKADTLNKFYLTLNNLFALFHLQLSQFFCTSKVVLRQVNHH